MIRFGVFVLQNAGVPALVERVRAAEELGFDQVWVGDHFVNPYAPEQPWFDGWVLLGALARVTSTVRLGTLVSTPTLRNPAMLARQVLTLDHLSEGRAELGLGAGGAPLDFTMTGVGPWDGREATERLGETVQIVIELLETGRSTRTGSHYRVEDAVLEPRPVQQPRPPLTVGALGERTIELAARHADRWNSYAVPAGRRLTSALTREEGLELTRQRVSHLDSVCRAIGRDPASIRRSFLTFFGYSEPVPSPDEFADFVDRHADAGMDEFVLYWPAEGGEALQRLATEAFPALRQR